MPDHAPLIRVLDDEETRHWYLTGFFDHSMGFEFHACPEHLKPYYNNIDEKNYQRGVEWRRGWNDAALGREADPIYHDFQSELDRALK